MSPIGHVQNSNLIIEARKKMSALTEATQELVARIITSQATAIRECEVQKEVLAQ